MNLLSRRSLGLLLCLVVLSPVAVFAEAGSRGPGSAPGLDGRFVELSRQVPGFGGYFFDENGDLNVYLTNLLHEPAARAAVADVARARKERRHQPWARPAEIVIRRGDFDYAQLDGWRGRLSAALNVAGVQLLDTDEAANRLYVGVTDEEARTAVLSLLDTLHVPRKAVVVEVVPSGQPIVTLQQYVRPLVGGLQVEMNGGTCSLGVNVWYTNLANGIGVGTLGFYTASHCSSTYLGTDSTVFSQGGTRVGAEAYDAPPFTSAQNTRCPANTSCRWSDVTFVAYDSGVNRTQGAVAQTQYRGFGTWQAGSLDLSSQNFTMNQTSLPVVGNYMDKVGRTTGWTSGEISRTCIDVIFSGYGILCQDEVQAYADNGDSGSPVFEWTGQTTGAFSGIVWWKTGTGAYIYSNYDRIAADMGNGVTYGPN